MSKTDDNSIFTYGVAYCLYTHYTVYIIQDTVYSLVTIPLCTDFADMGAIRHVVFESH